MRVFINNVLLIVMKFLLTAARNSGDYVTK